MANIQKRGETYQFTVSHVVNGKSRPIRKGVFSTKKEAQIAAAEIESQLSKGLLPPLTPVPIDEYFDKWVKLYKTNISVTTLKHYEYTSRAIKADFGCNKAKETVLKVNTHIRSCVKDAVDEQIIHRDFTRNANITWTVPAKKSDQKSLNYKESKLLLKEIWNRLDQGLGYSLLLLALTSGMRFGELVGLTRNDFDFVNNTIRINKTWGYLKRHHEGFGPTKNEQSNRTIIMDSKTMKHFKKLFKNMPTNIHQLTFYSTASKYKVISNTKRAARER
ncbi:Arm DNA-binding domain-containing protein [Bacillus sp. PDNC022]|uniref:Arm DNA-binding domain-containing protein n=1 Tax=Bacillus sp. PDNC022 TaxID=2812759 RepID=UPI0019638B2A|nr:Arm DNA-binding domain-containing protein [Bacillus sp. PDNC022]QRY35702.1 Arm DNA-binding domain-containing protein [Bacillus sp. PDNC022]